MIQTIIEPIKDAIGGMTLFDPNTTDTRLAGIVTPARRKEGVFPIASDVTGRACWEDGKYFELLPNDLYRAVVYFEQITDIIFDGYKEAKDKTMMYSTNIRLICWVNLMKFGEASPDQITGRLALGIIKELTKVKGDVDRRAGLIPVTDVAFSGALVQVVPTAQIRNDAAIFNRYTLKETNLLYPMEYFALDMTCYLEVGRECFDEVVPGVELLC